jgi:phosphatidylglycerophosphatase C
VARLRVPEGAPGGRFVAAFDFDGTLTRRDTLVPFLRRVSGWRRFTFAFVGAVPTLIMSRRRRDAFKAAVLHRLLRGMPADQFRQQAQHYGATLPARFRPASVERIRWHQEQGHEVVLVSASLRAYLDPVVEHLGLDGVCAVELEVGDDDRLTGRIVGPNCRGPEKVRRLDEWLDGDALERLWAYGNSSGDRELLAAAHEPNRVRRRDW